MGRNNNNKRKEDRHSRKRAKVANVANRSSGSTATASSSFAPPVLAKGQFATLRNKGKARQQQQQQQQQQQPQNQDDAMQDDHLTSPASAPSLSQAALQMHGIQPPTLDDFDFEPSSSAVQNGDPFSVQSRLDDTITGRRDSSIKAYMKEMRKVVENADVLLEVLDARDPMGCRSLQTERMLMRAGKKVVLILNKIDLVPKSNVLAWLKHLRHDFPTLAFKASTQSQRNNLSQGAAAFDSRSNSRNNGSSSKDAISGGAEAIGAGALLQLIKNYSRNLNLKTSITVGIFGAPNVGKSSLVNSLKRARVCSVASTPGHTKVVQGVMLDKSVRLLDCPGIVFSDESGSAPGLSEDEVRMRRQSALLRNVVKVELVEDPFTPVEAILARVDDAHLCQTYGLEFFQSGDAQDFLMRIAVQRGRIGVGGKLDLDGTARSVLHDWNVGKISYYTEPPALHRSAILTDQPQPRNGEEATAKEQQLAESSAILTGYSEAFDLAGLLGEADAEVFGDGGTKPSWSVPEPPKPRYATEAETEAIEDDHGEPEPAPADTSADLSALGKRRRGLDDSDDEMSVASVLSDEEDASVPATVPSGPGKRTNELATVFSAEELAGLAESRSAQRRKMKKLKKRAERSGAGLVGALESSVGLGQMQTPAAQSSIFGAPAKAERGSKQQQPHKVVSGRFAALMQEGEDDEDEDEEDMSESGGGGVVREEEEDMGAAEPTAAQNGGEAPVVEDIEEEL